MCEKVRRKPAMTVIGMAMVCIIAIVPLGTRARQAYALGVHPLEAAHARATGCAPLRVVPHPGTGLAAVSAVSANDVWAVGTTGQEGTEQPLIEHWDGTRWSIVPGAKIGVRGHLFSVAAISAHDVWAVGDNTERSLVEHWDGTRWSVVPGAVSDGYYLTAIAGVAGNDVWAVGTRYGGTATLMEHWDGRRWRVVPSPNIGPYGGSLSGLGAISPDDVWAVGDVVGSYRSALIEHWDGKRWLEVPGPRIRAQYSHLSGVAGIAAGDVWAVGSYDNDPGGFGSVIEHWNGRRWSLVPGPDIAARLGAVAVVSARDAWAVGGALVEHWDGTRWQVVPNSDGVGALAVVSPTDVWAVGSVTAHYTGGLCYATTTRSQVSTVHLSGPTGLQPDAESADPDQPGSLAVDSATRRAFVRDHYGAVSVIDLDSNTVLRTLRLNAFGAITVDEQRRRVYVPSGRNPSDTSLGLGPNGVVHVLDAASGVVLQTLPAGRNPLAVAVDDRSGRVFVANAGSGYNGAGSSVGILDAATGMLVATQAISQPTQLAADEATGRVFVLNRDGVATLDAMTGALLHTFSISTTNPTTSTGSPAVIYSGLALDERAGKMFVEVNTGDYTLTVSMLDARNGVLLRSTDISQGQEIFPGAMAVDEQRGRLYVVWNEQVGIVDVRNDALLKTAGVDVGPGAVAIGETTSRVYVLCIVNSNQYGAPVTKGSVKVFDATDGTLLSTLTVGEGPDEAAVDEQTGRALILDQDGLIVIAPHAVAIVTPRQPSPATPALPAAGARFFARARHNIGNPFLAFWLQGGGMDILGGPQTEAFVQGARLSQYTDRFLLQVVDGHVKTAPLGHLLTAGRNFPRIAPFVSMRDRLYFASTGHRLSGRFLTYWRAHQGARLLGAPISEVIVEGNNDGSGRRYPLQWFEKGRLEYHAELAGTRYAVEIGLLGVEALRQQRLT